MSTQELDTPFFKALIATKTKDDLKNLGETTQGHIRKGAEAFGTFFFGSAASNLKESARIIIVTLNALRDTVTPAVVASAKDDAAELLDIYFMTAILLTHITRTKPAFTLAMNHDNGVSTLFLSKFLFDHVFVPACKAWFKLLDDEKLLKKTTPIRTVANHVLYPLILSHMEKISIAIMSVVTRTPEAVRDVYAADFVQEAFNFAIEGVRKIVPPLNLNSAELMAAPASSPPAAECLNKPIHITHFTCLGYWASFFGELAIIPAGAKAFGNEVVIQKFLLPLLEAAPQSAPFHAVSFALRNLTTTGTARSIVVGGAFPEENVDIIVQALLRAQEGDFAEDLAAIINNVCAMNGHTARREFFKNKKTFDAFKNVMKNRIMMAKFEPGSAATIEAAFCLVLDGGEAVDADKVKKMQEERMSWVEQSDDEKKRGEKKNPFEFVHASEVVAALKELFTVTAKEDDPSPNTSSERTAADVHVSISAHANKPFIRMLKDIRASIYDGVPSEDLDKIIGALEQFLGVTVEPSAQGAASTATASSSSAPATEEATQKISVCIVGPHDSGKTTLLNAFTDGPDGAKANTFPTIGFNAKKFTKNGVLFDLWDLGGQKRFHNLWERYCRTAGAVIFAVDGSVPASEITSETIDAFQELFSQPSIAEMPLLLLANKSDVESTAKSDEASICAALKVDEVNKNGRKFGFLSVSAKACSNIDAVFDWIGKNANKTVDQ